MEGCSAWHGGSSEEIVDQGYEERKRHNSRFLAGGPDDDVHLLISTHHFFTQPEIDAFSSVLMTRKLRHGNICQLMGVCMEKDNLMLVMEYCQNGDVHTLLNGQVSQLFRRYYGFTAVLTSMIPSGRPHLPSFRGCKLLATWRLL